MTLEKNTLIHNRYRIVEILGQGGMGSVYKAIDENLGATVALKENLFTTDEYSRQFRLEAVILANLRHPNLPRVYDHFVIADAGQYLVMDYIEGEDLRQRMERMGTIAEEDAVQIGAAISDALSYLHSRKPPILHRDIKPGNIKVTPEGHIFLVDFGLAKVFQGTGQATTTGARAMTPGYSPPEQYGTARTDPRTDIYSLGATLYASLCGVIPEDGLARAMDNAQLTPLRKRNTKISRRVATAIEKAMSVDPSDRYQTADEFKKALLTSKSLTQQLPGSYQVAPPPEDSDMLEDPGEGVTKLDRAPRQSTGPVPPEASHEEQPFVSPLKKQKERERQRRNRLFRFVFVLVIIFLIGIPFMAPGLLPANIRNSIPFLVTPTQTPSRTPTPLPTSTTTQTATLTKIAPSATRAPTITPSPFATAVIFPTNTPSSTPPAAAESPTISVTAVGGGSGAIAYASNRTGVPQIYIVDLTSLNVVQLTDLPNGACQPAWSPAGDKLVFTSPCKGMEEVYYESGLYIMNADGSNVMPLPTVPGGDFDAAWSPDGNTLAFTSLRTGQMEIFAMHMSDQSVSQITNGARGVESRQAAWSPDGTKIVYTVKRLGVYQIWLMDSNGSNERQIVRSGTAFTDYLPTWSRDGQLILFNERCARTFCLPYVMSISGTDRSTEQGARLPFTALTIEDVEFSPDGYWLAYEGEEAGQNKDIIYMTVTGANRIRLTEDKGLDFDPTWRPVPGL